MRDEDIVADNYRALGAVLVAASLDEMRAFDVVDRLVELAQVGLLPLGQGSQALRLLDAWWRREPDRLNEAERREVYRRVLGRPDGNSEFDGIWRRFIVAVIQTSTDELRAAAENLRSNIAVHLTVTDRAVAVRLRDEIERLFEVLSEPDLRNDFAVDGTWELIERIALQDLGGILVGPLRTRAACESVITAWLAANEGRLSAGGAIDPKAPRPAWPPADLGHPSDGDLVSACEAWLASQVPVEP
ncbi:MAG: hypothetical protein U1E45_01855 [Geminicoccaceae bacterium]